MLEYGLFGSRPLWRRQRLRPTVREPMAPDAHHDDLRICRSPRTPEWVLTIECNDFEHWSTLLGPWNGRLAELGYPEAARRML